ASNHVEAGLRIAGRCDAAGVKQPLLLQPLEDVGDATAAEHVLGRKARPATDRLTELIVELKQRDAIGTQALEAGSEAALDGAAQIEQVTALDPHLGGNVRPRRQRFEMAPDRLLGGAIAIEGSGVDPVDAGLDRAAERGEPRRLIAPDQDSASIAATER